MARGLKFTGVMTLFVGALWLSEYVLGVYPLWAGQPIELAVTPVEAQSLLRGDYVPLQYEIGEVFEESDEDLGSLERGDIAFVHLRSESGTYRAMGISRSAPAAPQLFIRGQVQRTRAVGERIWIAMRYGIEGFHADEAQALLFERQLSRLGMDLSSARVSASVTVYIAPNGRAALGQLKVTGTPVIAMKELRLRP